MRSRILPVVGVAAVALVAGAAFAGQASASGTAKVHQGKVQPALHVAKKKSCFSNTAGDTGVAILSQEFTDSGFDIYDSYGAADFKVAKTCKIKKVQTAGQYFNGAGPADSLAVTIYKNKKGKPGKVVKSQSGLKYTDSTGIGSLGAKVKKIKLKKGSYWINVEATMAFSSGGEWGWELGSTTGAADLWENPGGGFGVCPKWDTVLNCNGYAGDFMVTF